MEMLSRWWIRRKLVIKAHATRNSAEFRPLWNFYLQFIAGLHADTVQYLHDRLADPEPFAGTNLESFGLYRDRDAVIIPFFTRGVVAQQILMS